MIIWHPDTEILLLVAAAGRIREKQPKQREQERSDMLWLLPLYSSIRYTNHNTHNNGCRKTHVHTWLVEEEGNSETFLGTVGLEGLNCAPEVPGRHTCRGGPAALCRVGQPAHPDSSLLCFLQRGQCCSILLSAYIKLNCAVKTSGLPLLWAFVKWAVGLLVPLVPHSVPWSSAASGLFLPQSFLLPCSGLAAHL